MATPTGLVVTRALAATLVVQVLVSVVAFTVPVFAPAAAADLGIDPSNVGIYTSLVYLGAMAASLAAGGLTLRHGAIRLSQFMLVLAAIGVAAVSGASWMLFVASALIVGLGYGPATPASSHLLARHTPPRLLGLVFSIKQTGVPMGAMIAGVLVPFLVVHFGWRGAAWGVAAICLVGTVLVQPTRREFDVDLKPTERVFRGGVVEPLRLILTSPHLRLLAFASFAFGSTQVSYGVFLVAFLVSAHGMDLQAAGFALSVAQAAGIGGRVLWGAVADRVGNARIVLAGLALGMAISVAATAFYPAAWPYGGLLVVAALAGGTCIGWNGVYLAEVSRLAPDGDVGRATGGALFITYFGVVVTPTLFGLLHTLSGAYTVGFLALAAMTGYVGFALFRSGGRPAADHDASRTARK